MNDQFQGIPKPSSDPIIDELHEIRARLAAKHEGDLHRYSTAARANAIKLGFKFFKVAETAEVAIEGEGGKAS